MGCHRAKYIVSRIQKMSSINLNIPGRLNMRRFNIW